MADKRGTLETIEATETASMQGLGPHPSRLQRLRGHWLWLILAVSIAVCIGLFALVIRGLSRQAADQRLPEIVMRVDMAIAAENYDDAIALLKDASALRRSAREWRRLLKRSAHIAQIVDDYSHFSVLASQAAESLPGNEQLWALAVYAALRVGDARQAFIWADRRLSSSQYQTLVAEAALRADATIADYSAVGAGVDSADAALLTTLRESANPYLYEAAHQLTGDQRYLINAMVLHLEAGNQEEVARLDATVTDRLLRAYVAYDNGQLDLAAQLLEQSRDESIIDPETLLLLADAYLHQHGYTFASATADAAVVDLYREIVERFPTASPVPYINLSWLDHQQVETWLQRGEVYFKQELAPHRLRAMLNIASLAEPAAAPALAPADAAIIAINDDGNLLDDGSGNAPFANGVADFTANHSDSDMIQLAEIIGRQPSPAMLFDQLWQLLEHHPDSVIIPRYLAWYASGIGATDELEALVRRYLPTTRGWNDFYLAVLLVDQRRYQEAIRAFERSLSTNWWEAHANIVLLALQSKRYDHARRTLAAVQGLALPQAIGHPALVELQAQVASKQARNSGEGATAR